MSGRPVLGLALALVIEARHWTRLRWDFDDDACGRAWQITAIATALAAVLIWLDGSRYTALPVLISWLPLLLLPMQFVQSYGTRDSLPLSIFSFLARRRRERNRRFGLIEETTGIHFGNVLFVTTMVAATVGLKSDTWLFLPGIIGLTAWMLLTAGRARPLTLLPLIALAALLAMAGKIGLEHATHWISGSAGMRRGGFDPNFSGTMIGSRGLIQQSPDIVWRLRPAEKSMPPPLLRTASFNTFLGTDWHNQRVAATDFKDLDTRLIGMDSYFLLLPATEATDVPSLPSFTLRGSAAEETPIPLPGNTAALRDFDLVGIERNPFGTVRIFPKESVIDGSVFWNGVTNPEAPPIRPDDLLVPRVEKPTMREIVDHLDLDQERDLRLKIAILRSWFLKEFRYTRNLSIRHGSGRDPAATVRPSAMRLFLTDVRAGHCEYFATAAALILREAGIPTRYATGFAVIERDPKRGEFLIRGTHSHAWCRVWNESTQTWIDFDATPPDWLAAAAPQHSLIQRFNDSLKRVREDFSLWRNRPANRLAVTLAVIVVGSALAGLIFRRLWQSKRLLEIKARTSTYQGPTVRTPLHELEAHARKHLGPRPPGQPFAQWFAGLRPIVPDAAALDEAITLHQMLRFDPADHPPSHRARLAEIAQEMKSHLRKPNRAC